MTDHTIPPIRVLSAEEVAQRTKPVMPGLLADADQVWEGPTGFRLDSRLANEKKRKPLGDPPVMVHPSFAFSPSPAIRNPRKRQG